LSPFLFAAAQHRFPVLPENGGTDSILIILAGGDYRVKTLLFNNWQIINNTLFLKGDLSDL